MCELFAMSSDAPVRVHYSISEFATHGGQRYANRDGWGIVFTQPRDAYLFKEPAAAAASPLEHMVANHVPPSSLVLAHVRRASSGAPALCNTHPFHRSVQGQARHFAHNGDLPDLVERYGDTDAAHDCIGDTDSELAFMLLQKRLGGLPVDAGLATRFDVFNDFCGEMRTFGDANFLYAEGDTLFVHAHKRRYEENGEIGPPRTPGLQLRRLDASEIAWRTHGAHIADESDHRILIASVPLDGQPWEELAEGTTLLIKGGIECARGRS